MDFLVRLAEGFIGLFQQGGEVFVSLVTGIVPLLIILLTFVNALIALIGTERIDRVGEWAARPGLVYYPVRYILLPFLSVFFLTNRWPIPWGVSSPSVTSQRSMTRPSPMFTRRRYFPAYQSGRVVCLAGHLGRHHRAGAIGCSLGRPLSVDRPCGHFYPRHRD